MNWRILIVFLLLITYNLCFSHTKTPSSDITVTGEVIGSVCYLHHDSKGHSHADCAKYCAEQGIPLAILEDKTDKIFLSIPIDHSDPNASLKEYIAKKVTVTGELFSKGGLTGIHIKKIKTV